MRVTLSLQELADVFEYQERQRRTDFMRPTAAEMLRKPLRELAEMRARTFVQDAAWVATQTKGDVAEVPKEKLAWAAKREVSAFRRLFPEACEEVARDSERELEAELARLLTEAGFAPERQVRTEKGIADIVVGDYVIEVKTRV